MSAYRQHGTFIGYDEIISDLDICIFLYELPLCYKKAMPFELKKVLEILLTVNSVGRKSGLERSRLKSLF